MAELGNLQANPVAGLPPTTAGRRLVLGYGRIALTTSGAIDTTNTRVSYGFTPAKETGTGLYSVTHPKCVTGAMFWSYYNAAGNNTIGATGDTHVLSTTCKSQIQTYTLADGAAADGASGDYIDFLFVGEA